ncbi:MAG: hypothetical protein AAF937_10305, partial [Planctomycetota bacterium]
MPTDRFDVRDGPPRTRDNDRPVLIGLGGAVPRGDLRERLEIERVPVLVIQTAVDVADTGVDASLCCGVVCPGRGSG